MTLQPVPYWRLSNLYFFYFTAVGIILPFWGLYLDFLNFTPQQIGIIVAVPMITKVVAPNTWGWLADKTGKHLLVIQIGAVIAVCAFVGVIFRTDFLGVLFFSALFTFFWNAILPQFEVITLDALGKRAHFYSRIRLWGSIGFIVAVVVLGWWFEQYGIARLPWAMWGILVFITLSTLAIPKTQHQAEPTQKAKTHFKAQLLTKGIISFFTASILLHISHGVFYGFYSLHLAALGYSKTHIGWLWAAGVFAEIIIFIKIPWIFSRFSLWGCYVAALGASCVRWVIVAYYPQYSVVMLVTQLFHALTFGVAHAVAIEIVRKSFSRQDRGKAQALYSALCFGAGGALGAYSSGMVWGYGAEYSFIFASIVSALGACVALIGMRQFHTQDI